MLDKDTSLQAHAHRAEFNPMQQVGGPWRALRQMGQGGL
jgi:hypothetical protein